MPTPFRHLNLDEQALAGSCSTAILEDAAVTAQKLSTGAVTASAISDGTITPTKFAPSVYGNGLVANGITSAIDVNVDGVTLQISADTISIKDGGVTVAKINIDNDLNFNNHQATAFRIENLSSFPSVGNPGRMVWRTDLSQLYVDTGVSFTVVGSGGGHTIEDHGTPLTQRSILNFVGSGVTVTDTGTTTQVDIASGGGSVLFTKDLFVVVTPSNHTLTLAQTPIANSEVVAWNGLVLSPGVGNDYTISSNVLTLNAGMHLTIGDEFTITYSY